MTTSRDAATITVLNLVSRATGFIRVVATAGALGIAALGDSYQRANQVSNVLFELLAGGMLFSVLVPTFVSELRHRGRAGAGEVASALALKGAAVLAAVAVVGVLAAGPIMTALTSGVMGPTRAAQVELGTFLLWFILPQLPLYAIGAVYSALLQSDRRFVATSVAPVCNNVIITITMVIFAVVHGTDGGLVLTTAEKVILGVGTLAGTVVTTAVPGVAVRRAGVGAGFRWSVPGLDLAPLMRRGVWAAGHIGLNQVVMLTTVVLAGAVEGGVIAYQTAFTFFLLPHALLAHPIFTALYPRMADSATSDDLAAFGGDLDRGIRLIAILVLPGAGLLAAVAAPALSLVEFGQFDTEGVRLVAAVLAAYLVGVAGYSIFFLLTRASYALGDAARPTLVNLGVTVAIVAGMGIATVTLDGTALLVSFGLIHAGAATAGSVVLHQMLWRRLGSGDRVAGSVLRSVTAAIAAAALAWGSVAFIGWEGPATAVLAIAVGALAGGVVYVTALRLLGSSDLDALTAVGRRLTARFW